jgi:hypothetical protein
MEVRNAILHDHGYTQQRIRKHLRPRLELAAWLQAIFTAFGPIRCSNTRKVLLPPKEMAKAWKVIADVRDGFVADLAGIDLYQVLYTERGYARTDRDGIKLRSCSRGSNCVENKHQKVYTATSPLITVYIYFIVIMTFYLPYS